MSRPHFLTKSRFKLGYSCPTKLYYTNKAEYANQNIDNPFLEVLAEGGFQVGELAKCYFPGGHDITTLDKQEALEQTNTLLQQDDVIIYEAAILFEELFIRVDILDKKDNTINLYEVKAKSFSGGDYTELTLKNKPLQPSSTWEPYIMDITFQKHVVAKALPQYDINAYLYLCDKTKYTTIDGLNQKFRVEEVNGRTQAIINGDISNLGTPILTPLNVDLICDYLLEQQYTIEGKQHDFATYCATLSNSYKNNQKLLTTPCATCWSCEFNTTPEDENKGLQSGYKECWSHWFNWTETEFSTPSIKEIWDYRTKDKRINEQRYFMKDLRMDEFLDGEYELGTLSNRERKWIQIQKAITNDPTPFIDFDGLKEEMASWVYPLHFIDFETSAMAVPFYKGQRPYESIAFQYSHHIVHENGFIEHKGEYLHTDAGTFPSFEFLRSIKKELEQDNGTIFRYADHENTIMNAIYFQLLGSNNPPEDKKELLAFIESISHSKKDSTIYWKGERDMVDMLKVVKSHYYHPKMKGSNSIKDVLPAVLFESEFLRSKYSKPIYGTKAYHSTNFENQIWYKEDENGDMISPYKLLPKVFTDEEEKFFLNRKTDLKDGGTAMTAYAKMQFTEMSETEFNSLRDALLRYCELDTLAMVMIYEYWREVVNG